MVIGRDEGTRGGVLRVAIDVLVEVMEATIHTEPQPTLHRTFCHYWEQ